MSFNPFAFESSIHNRLNTGVIAAAVQGVWNTKAPPDIKVKRGGDPYIVFSLEDGEYDPAFQTNSGDSIYRVSVYDHIVNGRSAKDVAALIYGDSEGTDNAPTVGLARWFIPAVSDIATAIVRPLRFGTLHTEDVLHYWQTFEVAIQEV